MGEYSSLSISSPLSLLSRDSGGCSADGNSQVIRKFNGFMSEVVFVILYVPVKREISYYDGVYFITTTCCEWLHLFEIANAYEAVYKWFDHLKSKRHHIFGYVIMPNHLHALVAFRNTHGESINKIVGTGKRFMAYEIVNGLRERGELEIMAKLSSFVDKAEGRRGKLHEVFRPSFDWKECETMDFIAQKLNYIHANPCQGVWNLVQDPVDYTHSSAKFYETGVDGVYQVTHCGELNNMDLTKW